MISEAFLMFFMQMLVWQKKINLFSWVRVVEEHTKCGACSVIENSALHVKVAVFMRKVFIIWCLTYKGGCWCFRGNCNGSF